ncbi:hypothetical protein O3597_00305 [Verrucosispora sp. WMMA2044]|uniref:hypothetical protein n=1 Tax=Verrucosispora sp. WMMA2044 TaxID=3016419 RepID=UPI00248C672A|nr:hypothetical protein [Verrucosispora sp. WMMA2044]WBB49008.1 hypothetical protein O3597_00305 [Verrucosispora sp. WMMA2044]
MSETGQPGAATPGEHGDGTGQRDDLARSGNGWSASPVDWSWGPEVVPGSDVTGSRSESPSGWATASSRHADLPAPVGEQAEPERPVRVNGNHVNGHQPNGAPVADQSTGGRHVPVSAPPGLRGPAQDAGKDRLVVPAPRPVPSGEQPGTAGTGRPTSSPPAVQVPPVGTAPSGFEMPPGLHAPSAERSADGWQHGWDDALRPEPAGKPWPTAPAADPAAGPADRPAVDGTDQPGRWPAASGGTDQPAGWSPAEPPVGGPDRPTWAQPDPVRDWAPPWARDEDAPTDRRSREASARNWASEPSRPYEPLRAEATRPYEPVRAERPRPYEPRRDAEPDPEGQPPIGPDPANQPAVVDPTSGPPDSPRPTWARSADLPPAAERPSWALPSASDDPTSPPSAPQRPSWARSPEVPPAAERPSWALPPVSGAPANEGPPWGTRNEDAPPWGNRSGGPPADERLPWALRPASSPPAGTPSGAADPTSAPPAAARPLAPTSGVPQPTGPSRRETTEPGPTPPVAEARSAGDPPGYRPFRLRPVPDEPAPAPAPVSAPPDPTTTGTAPPGEIPGASDRRERTPSAPVPTSAAPYAARRSAPDPVPPTEPAGDRSRDSTTAVLPQRVPAEPDVPVVPEPPAVEPPAETPELARIATHLRRDDEPAPLRDRPEGFDVNAILAAVRGVEGVRDAALRRTPAGAHSLRLDLADGADPAEVSRHVARLLQERMGLAAAPRGLPGVPAVPVRRRATESRSEAGETRPSAEPRRPSARPGGTRTETPPSRPETVPETTRRRRQSPAPNRGRAVVDEPGASGSPATLGASYSGGQLTTTESAPSRPLDTGGAPGPRVVLDHVQVSTFGLDANVEVRLVAGDRNASGYATGPAVDGFVLRLCGVAAAAAIDELLYAAGPTAERGRCFVEHAAVVPFGNCEVATVVVLLVCDGWVEQLAGSALVAGDPRQAVVRATLAAVNRRLEALLA